MKIFDEKIKEEEREALECSHKRRILVMAKQKNSDWKPYYRAESVLRRFLEPKLK